MRRWAFNILAAISLVILVVTMGFWAFVEHIDDGRWGPYALFEMHLPIDLFVADTHIFIFFGKGSHFRPSHANALVLSVWTEGNQQFTRGNGPYEIEVPYWNIALATALMPLLWLYLFVRRKYKAGPHSCPACHYDLRGTIEAGRTVCPECGANVPFERA